MTKHPIEVITSVERRRRWSREDNEPCHVRTSGCRASQSADDAHAIRRSPHKVGQTPVDCQPTPVPGT